MLALLLLFVSRDGHVATGLLQRSLLGLQLSSWKHPSPPALCSSTCSRSFQSLQKEASVGGSEGWAHPHWGGLRWPWRHTHFSLCSAAPLLKMFCYSYTRIYYILMCSFKMCHSKLTSLPMLWQTIFSPFLPKGGLSWLPRLFPPSGAGREGKPGYEMPPPAKERMRKDSSRVKLCSHSMNTGTAGTQSRSLCLHPSETARPTWKAHPQGLYPSHLGVIKSKWVTGYHILPK